MKRNDSDGRYSSCSPDKLSSLETLQQQRRHLQTTISELKLLESSIDKRLDQLDKRMEQLESCAYELSRVTDVAQLALNKLDSWSIDDIKAYINSLCSYSSINHSGIDTKEELERLLTRFWLCNPERMPEYRAMMKKK